MHLEEVREEDESLHLELSESDEIMDEEAEEYEVQRVVRGRVRLHGKQPASSGLDVDEQRQTSLAERRFVRTVVKRGVGPCGGADFDACPDRANYPVGDGHATVHRRELQPTRRSGADGRLSRTQGWAFWGLSRARRSRRKVCRVGEQRGAGRVLRAQAGDEGGRACGQAAALGGTDM